ncbi:hypothetical protein GCM10017688_35950 [Streptomyces ramulosus]
MSPGAAGAHERRNGRGIPPRPFRRSVMFRPAEPGSAEPGSEEYRDSEKYQLRPCGRESAPRNGKNLAPLIIVLDRARRRPLALRQLRRPHFHDTGSEVILAHSPCTGRVDAPPIPS